MRDEKPSKFFENATALLREYPFTMISDLKTVPQSPIHHPEGNVWNHTMLVIDHAAERKDQSSDSRAFMWAAVLHDIGKKGTTRDRKGKITSYDHDKYGAKMAEKFLDFFNVDAVFKQKVAALVRFHMHILYVVNSLPFSNIKEMQAQTNINDVALLGLCDRLGRLGADAEKETQTIKIFQLKCGLSS